ncbi:MAG: type IV toxin-antitoxin system AbiEi family antitoxin [Natronosporangium sp.]
MSSELLVSAADARWRIRERYVRGQVTRLRRGLYAPPGHAERLTVSAAVRRLDAVASLETAASIWGIPTLGAPASIQLTRARRAQGTARYDGVVVHHARLGPGHVTWHDGIPVTTAARTVMDLARNRPFRAGVVAADAALRTGVCTREELRAVADTCRRWPGVARARAVAAFADPRAASPLESISRVAFHDYHLPRPILQATIGGYELADFLWPDCRVIGEADGLGKYTSPEVLRREKVREEGLVQLGFTVFRWTWREAYRRPDALAHRALEILTRCGYRP